MQRVVFPGSDGKVFTPQIQGSTTTTTTGAGQPATTAMTDLLTRMDTLEAQIARLTGQIELNTNRIAQLEARAGITASTPGTTAAPTPLIAPTTPAAPTATPTPTPTPAPTPAPQANLNAMTGGASAKPAAATGPSADRLKAVRAIEKPATSDPGDDEYSYGYRLWDAKFFPEAEQQLKFFAEKYPKHAKISHGRNLLGRAFLDDGKPREAAQWFLQNYQADKKGARAPDSLLFLAVAMKQLKDTNRACIALAEFAATYSAEATGRLKGTYDATRNGLKCS
jgi:TolA-binding protein